MMLTMESWLPVVIWGLRFRPKRFRVIQKKLIRKANIKNKLVITATPDA